MGGYPELLSLFSAYTHGCGFIFRKTYTPIFCPRSALAISILRYVLCPLGHAISYMSLVEDHVVPAVRADHPLIGPMMQTIASATPPGAKAIINVIGCSG